MSSGVRVGGVWRTPATVSVKVAGTWRTVATVYTRVGGVWKTSDLAGPPPTPTLTYTGTGQFTISNYSASQVYTVTNGTRSGAVITVPTATSVMTVTTAYAAGAPVSSAASGERRQYTTTPTDVFESFVHGLPPDGISNYGGTATPDSVWLYCVAPAGESLHQRGYNRKDATPSGFTDSGTEWWKVY